MEEIESAHQLNLEWGCLTNLANKICEIECSIKGGWPELADLVADIMTEEGENKDPVSAFFDLYSFMWRLFYRVKVNPKKRGFNIIEKRTDHFGKEIYWVTNYDYKYFKWARANGFGDSITNDWFTIAGEKLTDKQRRSLDKRCKKEDK